ncbi:uncharacterized protein LOC108207662 [Daucus carota subsp. sativus]|uniref:uncharacterized protein LOC108207662 n=1 Tax=Daucus carota subsp. sativus TaxID=79200 RepID=UPI0030831B17
METLTQLLKQHYQLFGSMYLDAILGNNFIQIHSIRDAESPRTLEKIADNFFKNLMEGIIDVGDALRQEEINFGRILEIVSNLKDAANSFGAPRLVLSCEAFRICYKNDNIEGFVHCQKHLKNDFLCLKKTLKAFFQLEHKILAAGGTVPIIKCPVKN